MSVVDADLIAQRAHADQAASFYRNHLAQIVATYRACVADHPQRDRTDILAAQVSELMKGELSRMDLCNELAIAIDRLAHPPS